MSGLISDDWLVYIFNRWKTLFLKFLTFSLVGCESLGVDID
jgi:hypothetical protein